MLICRCHLRRRHAAVLLHMLDTRLRHMEPCAIDAFADSITCRRGALFAVTIIAAAAYAPPLMFSTRC